MANWQRTKATLNYFRLVKVVYNPGGLPRTTVMFKPETSYVYNVDNKVYQNNQFMLVDRAFNTENKAWSYTTEKLEIASPCKYPNCPEVEIYFDPKNPVHSILIREYSLIRIIAIYSVLIVGFGIFAIACLMTMRKS